MHCHVGFCPDAPAAAAALAVQNVSAFSCSVTPAEYEVSRAALANSPNVRVALGLHPWWLTAEHADAAAGTTLVAQDVSSAAQDAALTLASQGTIPAAHSATFSSQGTTMAPPDATPAAYVEQFLQRATNERFIGEVGMDLSPRHAGHLELQQAAFRRIVRGCALKGGKVLSIHAVRSASIILDELNSAGLFRLDSNSVCIFHWFSGTPSELKYAKEAGCYFSINPRMLESKRGRFYAQNIPLGQLLLETDAPEAAGDQIDAADICARLEALLDGLAQLRHVNRDELAETIAASSKALLGL